ncbi:MAG: gamma-glutamyl-gamma-aminobutyrate hydrolase family protein [Desulfobacterales bacterium]|jgi:putative glutamine amidotransferase|nr:gamma-glutamyl-gamma-aminobutyrate hydrolase family protein [Desulfobacterales bacterium]MDP6684298.1 gamma-glutamyl-gamma-aminobutyrate hydrolase family protein [Desulfobacterales bacterium]MDP6808156.1 gamma-glutamyl-gamma-aminobutyrate hydrolase family protein [Desulfobacterales bacterium]|tara:strand:- start:10766 stop:11533 length:768 start_codon:yes stop_codon:yes gene_type:complete
MKGAKMMRPLIGITCSRVVGGTWSQNSPGRFMDYAFDEYSSVVHHCGGAPILIPTAQNHESLQSICERLNGVILTGGPDIDPHFYGEEPLSGLGEIDEAIDLTELAVVKIALKKDLPILGICRGLQVLNVSEGGTLYQDIPSQVKESINHLQKKDKSVNAHYVRIDENTGLHLIFKRKKIQVNSRHHQAIKDLASSLIVTAWAQDGLIEAVENPSRTFVIGVQWHPEGTWKKDAFSKKLFHSLIRASKSAAKQKS